MCLKCVCHLQRFVIVYIDIANENQAEQMMKGANKDRDGNSDCEDIYVLNYRQELQAPLIWLKIHYSAHHEIFTNLKTRFLLLEY